MICAQHLSNDGKNYITKKKPHSIVIFLRKVRRSCLADPAKEN